MAEGNTILCCGSLTLDVAAEPTQPGHAVRRKGRVTAMVGGGAFNMAVDLKAHGVESSLLTAVNDQPLAQLFRTALDDIGIRAALHEQPDLPDSIFAGFFEDGDLVQAVTSSAAEQIIFPDSVIDAALADASAVILTLVFNNQTVRQLAAAISEADLPAFVAINTESRARRLPDLADLLRPLCHAAFMNEREAIALCDEMHLLASIDGLTKRLQGVTDRLNIPLVVTRGAQGLTLFTPGEAAFDVPTQALPVPGNTMGAGDLVVAATAYFYFIEKLTLPQAVSWAPARMGELLKRTAAYLEPPP